MITRQPVRRLASFILKHRHSTLIVVLALTTTLAVGGLNIRLEINPDEQLPQDHPYVAAFRDVHRLFGDKDLLVIALTPATGDIADPVFLHATRQAIARIAELPGCEQTLLQGIGSTTTKEIVLAPDGLRVRPVLSTIPTSPAEIAEFRSRILNDPDLRGTLVSNDGHSLAIYATFEPTPELPGYVNIIEHVEGILNDESHGIFEYRMSGPVAIVAGLTIYAGRALELFPVSLVIISVILYAAFGTWQAVALPLLTGLLGVIWAVGLMGLLHIPLDPFNSTTPVLILAIGTGHAVQILKRYYEALTEYGASSQAIVVALSSTGTATIAAASIAALSFISLTSLGTASMRRFGMFTAFGILSTLVIELTLIPALRATLPDRITSNTHYRGWISLRFTAATQCLARWTTHPTSARILLGVYALLTTTCLLLAPRFSTDSSFIRQFGANHPVRLQDSFINSHFAGANVLIVVVSSPPHTSLATSSRLRAADRFERRIELLPDVGAVTSITNVLKKMHTVLNPGTREGIPETNELLTQYLFLYSLSGGNELATQITADYRSLKIVVLLKEDSTASGEATIEQIRELAGRTLPSDLSIKIAGTIASNLALTETMVRGKLLNIGQIIVITTTISAIVLRSIIGGLLVLMPLTLAVLVNFGTMSLAGIPLDVGTAAVSAMAVGIGADYAIYFLFRLRDEMSTRTDYQHAVQRTMGTAGHAVIAVASAVGIGYAVLCIAGYQLYVHLGLLIGLAMIVSCMTAITVIPAAITVLADRNSTPRFLTRRKRDWGNNDRERGASPIGP